LNRLILARDRDYLCFLQSPSFQDLKQHSSNYKKVTKLAFVAAELFRLLGGAEASDSDTEYDSEDEDGDDSGFDSDCNSDDEAQVSPTPQPPKRVRMEPPKIPATRPLSIRVSHALDSAFKFNTAMTLSQDSPCLVTHGNCCLDCSLKCVLGLRALKVRQSDVSGFYYIIDSVKILAKTTPFALPIRRAIQAGK
jgi:hypothetical protein